MFLVTPPCVLKHAESTSETPKWTPASPCPLPLPPAEASLVNLGATL